MHVALKPFNHRMFYQNKIFDSRTKGTNNEVFAKLKKELNKKGITISTIDLVEIKPDIEVYFDLPYPWELNLWYHLLTSSVKKILFCFEPDIVNPFNYMKIFHFLFKKVYTWKDSLVDNKRYFKFFFPNSSSGINKKVVSYNNKEELVLVNTNLLPFLPFKLLSCGIKELYSERVKAMDYFDKKYKKGFAIFGKGWNKPERFSLKQRVMGPHIYHSYRGAVDYKEKIDIISRFKYYLCFENSILDGYIDAKIIDCFKARCVPIYWGALNISKYISEDCFIDFKKFDSYDNLFNFLNDMSIERYNTYIKSIEKWLRNKENLSRWFDSFNNIFLDSIKV